MNTAISCSTGDLPDTASTEVESSQGVGGEVGSEPMEVVSPPPSPSKAGEEAPIPPPSLSKTGEEGLIRAGTDQPLLHLHSGLTPPHGFQDPPTDQSPRFAPDHQDYYVRDGGGGIYSPPPPFMV